MKKKWTISFTLEEDLTDVLPDENPLTPNDLVELSSNLEELLVDEMENMDIVNTKVVFTDITF